MTRYGQSLAEGTLQVVNAGTASYELAPGELVVQHSTSGQRYWNVDTLRIRPQSSASAALQAEDIGEVSTAAAGTLTVLETPLAGVTITNPATLIGSDEEGDDGLRGRTNSLFSDFDRRSFLDAALSARNADGSIIGINRVRGYLSPSRVYVANVSGVVAGSVSDPETDLGRVAELVRAAGSTPPTVASASALAINVSYSLDVIDASPWTDGEIEDAVEAVLTAFMAYQPIGGFPFDGTPGRAYADAIDTAIRTAFWLRTDPPPLEGMSLDDEIVSLSVSSPAADVPLTEGQAPVLGTVTPSITRIP